MIQTGSHKRVSGCMQKVQQAEAIRPAGYANQYRAGGVQTALLGEDG